MAKKKAKKRSQAPVALVYFITLLLTLSLAGGLSYYLLKKYEIFKPASDDSKEDGTKSVNILFARLSDRGDFEDLCVFRVDPFKKEIVIVPQPAVTKTSGGKQYKEVMKDSGMKGLERAVEETLGVSIDNYATVSDSAFEQVADLMGGMSYTAPQELYHISQESGKDDISIQKGDLVTLTGRQIRNLMTLSNLFNDSKQGNLTFQGLALEGVVNNGFRQNTMLKDNLFNIYEILTKNSDTDITKEVFNKLKRYLNDMLEERDIPARNMAPQGYWNNDYTAFTMKNDYIASVQDAFGVKKQSSQNAQTTKPTEPPPSEPSSSSSK